MKISVITEERMFSAQAHWVVHNDGKLLAASIVGFPTAVQAIAASAIEGRLMSVQKDSIKDQKVETCSGTYSKIVRQVGEYAHGLIMDKRCLLKYDGIDPVVIALNETVEGAIGRWARSRFMAPAEWEHLYHQLIGKRAVRLQVMINPVCQDRVSAVTMTDVSEEWFIEAISSWIKKKNLVLPQSKVNEVRFDPEWDMKTYLKENAVALARQLEHIRPLWSPERDRLGPEFGELLRVPFPAQAYVIEAIYKAFQQGKSGLVRDSAGNVVAVIICRGNRKTAFLCGEMGCGKTIMAIGIAYLTHRRSPRGSARILIAAPAIAVPKWDRLEIKETVPDVRVRVIESTRDALKYYYSVRCGDITPGLEFVLVSTDRAKLGPEQWCCAIWKRMRGSYSYAWHCPTCGEVLIDKDEAPLGWSDLAESDPPPVRIRGRKQPNGLPEGFFPKWKVKGYRKCPHCTAAKRDASIWRPALKSRGESRMGPRWFVSRILKKLKHHFDLFVQDEVHETGAQDSGRGDSFASLVKSGKRVLNLTGTLTTGQASSIKETLWRTEAWRLIADGFDANSGAISWARRYGTIEQVFYHDEEEVSGVVTRRKRRETKPVEKPGISPLMVARHLLDKVVTIDLVDLGLPLVRLDEIPVFLKFDEEHDKAYKSFHENLYEECKMQYAKGNKHAFARFIPAVLNYADRPDLGAAVIVNRQEAEESAGSSGVIYAKAFPVDYYHAKERELVRIVRENFEDDRGVWIYATYTDGYNVHRRLQEVLAAHGIEATILNKSVSPGKRIDWIADAVRRKLKVVISNFRLVSVALDLWAFPSIVDYQLSYEVNLVRQANRRPWRIGQTRDVRNYYLVYEDSQQTAQLARVMCKRGHAMLAEGRLDRSELAAYARDEYSALAMDVANSLIDANELKQRWISLAQKDIDPALRIIGEENFISEVTRIQRELVEETLRLCGAENRGEVIFDTEVATDSCGFPIVILPRMRARKSAVNEGQLSLFDLLSA